MKRFLSSLALLFLPALVAPASTTYYVATNGNDDVAGTDWSTALLTITNAVVKSSTGDLILVSNGTYYATGPGVVSSGTNFIYINTAITLKSFSGNPEDTILHGNSTTSRLVMLNAKGAVLDGFMLTNGFPGGHRGGGLAVFDSALITNCIITGCRSDFAGDYGAGGGVYMGGNAGNGVITMAWCRVIGNSALYTRNVQNGGGGIYCQTNPTVSMIISNCDIGYNAIGAGEGAGICGSRNVRVYNSHIFGNTVVSNAGLVYAGGGVSWHYGGAYLKDCVISNNICTNYAYCYGGGAKNCILDHCQVLSNIVSYGGGGVFGGIVSNNSVIVGNHSVGYFGGGAHGSYVYDTLISNNTTLSSGGGVAGYPSVVSNCVIVNNWSRLGGGGIHYYADVSGLRQEAINCVIMNNIASNGAGVYLQRNNPTIPNGEIRNCLIANNASTNGNGGGIYGNYGIFTEHRVVSCTIVSNYAAFLGGGVYIADFLSFTNCLIVSNSAGVSGNDGYGGNSSLYWACGLGSIVGQADQGNLALAGVTLFRDFAGGDFRPAAGAPVIDAGTNQPWMPPARDLDASSRIIGGRADIGCYEYTNVALSCVFDADQTWGLGPLTSVFNAVVSGTNTAGLYYRWDFAADGTPDLEGGDLAVVTNTYATPGYYSVALLVSNDAGQVAGLTNINYIKVGPLTYYVAANGLSVSPFTNWAAAATDLLAAISLASDWDTVTVTNGTYTVCRSPTLYGLQSHIPVTNGVRIQSVNGPDYTTITRTPTYSNRLFVLNHSNAALVGLTLSNGVMRGPGYGTPNYDRGGAVWMYNGTISNCVIKNNMATNYGGGVYMAGGQLVNSVICDNIGSNYGGGVSIVSYGLIRNCLVVSNRSVYNGGGGIYMSSYGTAENCTVVGNIAPNYGGGISLYGNPYVVNCVIVSNLTGSGTYQNWATNGTTRPVFTNCCTYPTNGLTGGSVHVETLEGVFVDYVNGNYRLGPGSACIDAGTNRPWMTTGVDLDGLARISGASVDIGAYERSLFDAAAAPANVQASDGTYVDQVLVTWETNACTNATGYQVFRSLAADPAGADQLSGVPDASYADVSATNGVLYYYWVRATNGYTFSDLSASNTGWRAIVPPTGVTASDGSYSGKVAVTWATNACTNATGYYVWRNDSNDAASALNLAEVVGTNYDDTSAMSNVSYYYWVQATNALGPGGTNSFSAPDTGYWAQWYYVATNGDDNASGIDWSAPLLTISNGVARAQRWLGGGVTISNGVYQSGGIVANNGTNMVYITNGITVKGFSGIPADVIVDGGGSNRCFWVYHNGAVVADLTLQGGHTWGGTVGGGGMLLYAGLVTNCVIVSNRSSTSSGYDGGGAYVFPQAGSTCRLDGCTLAQNTAVASSGGGLCLRGTTSTNIAVLNCLITNNIANTGGGGVYGETGGVISNCVVAWNMATNIGAGYGGGIRASGSGWVIRDCPSIYNNRGTRYGGGIYMSGASVVSNCVISNNYVIYSGNGLGGGLYLESSARVTHSLITSNAAVEYNGRGGGVYITSSALVTNCTIFTNKAYWGGGIYGSGYVRNCTNISYNAAVFSVGALARGGGLYMGSGLIADCIISNNVSRARGGGLTSLYGTPLLISNCVFDGNYAPEEGGGVEANRPGIIMRNCLITRNVTAGNGGGVDLYGTTDNYQGRLLNCTIVSNRANGNGGGLYVYYTNYVANTIIYSNSATSGADVYTNSGGGGMTFTNCCVANTNNLPGSGNFTNYPQFLNPAAGNWRLGAGSPCINRGLYDDWMAGALDKDGNARILGGTVDLGAYEYPLYLQVSPLGITNTLASGASTGTLVEVWSGDTNVELNYAASSTNEWIFLGVSNGAIAVNTTNTLWVTNDSAGLAAGTYTGAVLLVATNSLSALYPPDTQTVTVIMTILPPGPPTNVQATDGAYADKVVVTWDTNLCTNATGYAVWRSISADTNSASILSAASDTSYIDTSAANGVLYYYWVQATNAGSFSDLSESNTGYRALAPPTGITASDGTYTGKVVVTWQTNMCTNAVGYSVWRNTAGDLTSATRLVGVAGTNYEDTSAMSNVSYYYWIQATNTLSQTNASAGGPDTGYWALWYYVATNGSDANPGLDWTAPAASISNAVTNASHCGGGGVFVSNGIYALTAQISVTTNLMVRSWHDGDLDRTNTIVDAQRFGRCFYLNNSNASVAGFTIRNGSNTIGGGVCIDSSGGTVSNCIITDNLIDKGTLHYQGGGGVYMSGSAAAVRNCVIQRNQRLEAVKTCGGAGVMMTGGGLLKDCEIVYNTNSAGLAGGGGGVYVYNGGTVDHCQVVSNVSGAYIGGLYLYGTAIQLTNCAVVGNSCPSSFGNLYAAGLIVIADCVISNNTCSGSANAQSGGVILGNGVLMRNCQIVNNSSPAGNKKGGLCISGVSTVMECIVRGNAPGGVSSDQNGNGSWRMINCLIVGNTGNGVETLRYPSIINCTIVSNTGTGLKDYNTSYPTTGQVVNSIIYLNRTANYAAGPNSQFIFTNSCTTPLPPLGAGNFTDNPAFVNPNAANFRLQPGSACINAGTNDVWMDTAVDLQGRPRIRYGRVDVGCYEYWLNVKVNGVPLDRILRLNGVNQNRIFRINQ